MSANRPNRDRIPTAPFTSFTLVTTLYSTSSSEKAQNLIGTTSGKTPAMVSLPRVDCPVCGRDTATYPSGLLYRHDPASGRTPELKSCPGSLKLVREPGELLLFGSTGPGPDPADGLF